MLCRCVYLCLVFAVRQPHKQAERVQAGTDFPIHTALCGEIEMIFAAAPQSAREGATERE